MDLGYWSGAASSFARNLRTAGFAREVATAGLVRDQRPAAPTRFVLDAFPELEGLSVDLGEISYRRSNLDPMEQFALSALCQARHPKVVFEIGTYDGASTLLLARNAPEARVVTLDLPPDESDEATVAEEVRNASQGAGSRFHGTPEEARIEQLLGDSRVFDFSPWYGTVDLVLVDAGHEYDCASADSRNALKLLAPGGMVVWDDYQVGWPGVVRAVDELGLPVVHLASTDFAVYAA